MSYTNELWPIKGKSFFDINDHNYLVHIKWSRNLKSDYQKLSENFFICGYKVCEKIVDKINNELHSNVCISDIDEKTFTCYCMGKVEFKYPEAVILDAVIEKNSMIMYLEGYDENGLLDGGRANEIIIQELTKDNIELAIETYKKLKHSQTISYKDKIKISNGKIIK